MRIDGRPMTPPALLTATVTLLFAAAPLIAGEAAHVEWSQLPDPSVQAFEDPYRDLAPQQMSDLMSLVRLREELPTTGSESKIKKISKRLNGSPVVAGDIPQESLFRAAGIVTPILKMLI